LELIKKGSSYQVEKGTIQGVNYQVK